MWESTSGNWSGYAVPSEVSKTTDMFNLVEGAWQIPTVKGGTTASYSSTWVGLDGYTTPSVEQTGTEQDWDGTAQQNYVWFEMYPSPAYEIVGFPANPGDIIWAQVKFVAETKAGYVFQLTIENLTQNAEFAVPTSYTTVKSAGRKSAEWIVEAPFDKAILPLANYGVADFVECEAIGIGKYSIGLGKSGVLEPISSWPSDPMTMVDPNGGRSTPFALTSGGTAFITDWTAK
jgi:hypothetical protein